MSNGGMMGVEHDLGQRLRALAERWKDLRSIAAAKFPSPPARVAPFIEAVQEAADTIECLQRDLDAVRRMAARFEASFIAADESGRRYARRAEAAERQRDGMTSEIEDLQRRVQIGHEERAAFRREIDRLRRPVAIDVEDLALAIHGAYEHECGDGAQCRAIARAAAGVICTKVKE